MHQFVVHICLAKKPSCAAGSHVARCVTVNNCDSWNKILSYGTLFLGCCPTNASLTTVLIGNRIWSRSCIWGMMVGRTFQHWLNEQVWKCTNLHPKSPEIQYVFGFRNIIVFCVLVVFLRCVFFSQASAHCPSIARKRLIKQYDKNRTVRTVLLFPKKSDSEE